MSFILTTNYLHFQNALVHDTVVDCFHGLLYENQNVGVYEIKVHRIEIRVDTLFESEIWGTVNTRGKGRHECLGRINSTSNNSKHGICVFFIYLPVAVVHKTDKSLFLYCYNMHIVCSVSVHEALRKANSSNSRKPES